MINNSIVIDTDNYLGSFPFRKLFCNTPAELAKIAEENNVDVLCAASINAIFYRNSMDGNMELYESVKTFEESKQSPVKYALFAVINPTYTGFEKDIEKAHELGFSGIELLPLYHRYTLGDAKSTQAAKLAASYHMPIRIRDGFEDFRQRHQMDVQNNLTPAAAAAMVKAVPEASYIFTGFWPEQFLSTDLKDMIPNKKDLFFSTFKLDLYHINNNFDTFLEKVGADHIVIGSNAPFAYMEPQFLRLENSKKATQEDLVKIYGANIKPYLNL